MPIIYILECNKCYIRSMQITNLKELKKLARNRGWFVKQNEEVICSTCKENI